jgi:hypothetical protein
MPKPRPTDIPNNQGMGITMWTRVWAAQRCQEWPQRKRLTFDTKGGIIIVVGADRGFARRLAVVLAPFLRIYIILAL